MNKNMFFENLAKKKLKKFKSTNEEEEKERSI